MTFVLIFLAVFSVIRPCSPNVFQHQQWCKIETGSFKTIYLAVTCSVTSMCFPDAAYSVCCSRSNFELCNKCFRAFAACLPTVKSSARHWTSLVFSELVLLTKCILLLQQCKNSATLN